MNRKMLYGLVGLAVVLAFAVYLVNDKGVTNRRAENETTTAMTYQNEYKSVTDACALFTLEDAKKVIGDSTKADTALSQNVDGDDGVVAACTYSTTDGSSTKQAASLLLRSPKTQNGANSNLVPFTTAKPQNAEPVDGVGENSYWDPKLAQLNTLYKGNWLIITAGSPKAAERTQDKAVQAANLILPKI